MVGNIEARNILETHFTKSETEAKLTSQRWLPKLTTSQAATFLLLCHKIIIY